MYDTLYATLNKSENATLQYFIFCEKVLGKVFIKAKLYSFLRLKLYSLNFAIAHAQKRLLCSSEIVILVLH